MCLSNERKQTRVLNAYELIHKNFIATSKESELMCGLSRFFYSTNKEQNYGKESSIGSSTT